MTTKRGKFIVIEGMDGAGTTTQSEALYASMVQGGHDVILTREPTSAPAGKLIREILSGRYHSYPPDAVAALFAADRLDHIANEIEPALAAGKHVICDRYTLSSYVYQTISMGSTEADEAFVAALNARALKPDVTLVLLVRLRVALERVEKRATRDSFETDRMMAAVQAQYERASFDDALIRRIGNVGIVRGDLPLADVTDRVTRAAAAVIGERIKFRDGYAQAFGLGTWPREGQGEHGDLGEV